MVICPDPVHPTWTGMGNPYKKWFRRPGRGYPVCLNQGRVAYPRPTQYPIYIVIFLNILYNIYKLLVNIYLGYICIIYLFVKGMFIFYGFIIYRSKRKSKLGRYHSIISKLDFHYNVPPNFHT